MKSVLICIFSLAFTQYVDAACNVCNKNNGVACISDQEYYLCENESPQIATTYSCSGHQICTGLPAICVNRTLSTAVLGCSKILYRFRRQDIITTAETTASTAATTTAATTAATAASTTPATTTPATTTAATTIAASTTPATTTPDTTTSTITTTVATTQTPVANFCLQRPAGRYPMPNDSTCRNFILCHSVNPVMQTIFLGCPGQTFFNPLTGLCGTDMPPNCI